MATLARPDYLRARYYDPSTGQFISRDPAVATTRQPYAYVADNPLNLTDPSGLMFTTGFEDAAAPTPPTGVAGTYFRGFSGREYEVCAANPLSCYTARTYASFARTQAQARYPGQGNEGRYAAFEHTLWNALMSRDLGCDVAQQFADAHEYASPDPELAIARAYRNNAIGRRIGSRYQGADSTFDLVDAVQLYLDAGQLTTDSAVGLPSRYAR